MNGAPRHNPVFGAFPSSPIALVVAEWPGDTEVELGRPLVGATGMQFNESLIRAGLRRSELAIVYATCCTPLSKKKAERAVIACNGALLHQLKHLPRTIPTLAMGKSAHFALRGVSKGVMNERGFVRRDFLLPQVPLSHRGGGKKKG